MKVTTVAVKDIYPIVATAMDKRKAQYKKNIENYIKSRADKLYDTVPISRLPFGTEDVNDYFKLPKERFGTKRDVYTTMGIYIANLHLIQPKFAKIFCNLSVG